MRDAAEAAFPFVSDPEGRFLDLFGVRHEQGMAGVDIAQSANFLLDANGTIVWRRVADNYRVRARPEEILAAVDRFLP